MITEESVRTTQDGAIALAEEAASRDDTVIAALFSTAAALTIETSGQLEASGELLKDIKRRQKTLADLRLSITRPMDTAKKRVMELFQPAVNRLANAERLIKAAVLTYTQEQERLRREAQAKLDAEAERERVNLLKQADAHRETGREGRAETLEHRAEEVQAPTVAPAQAPRGPMHVRETWHAEVTDFRALVKACAKGEHPLSYLQPNMGILNGLARSLHGRPAIAGVKAVAEKGITARS